jgi:hypothetical protein
VNAKKAEIIITRSMKTEVPVFMAPLLQKKCLIVVPECSFITIDLVYTT